MVVQLIEQFHIRCSDVRFIPLLECLNVERVYPVVNRLFAKIVPIKECSNGERIDFYSHIGNCPVDVSSLSSGQSNTRRSLICRLLTFSQSPLKRCRQTTINRHQNS
ncbi:hypothetical protein [Nostoc sp. FACHB-888]|uniref:hypothetical protein n=1 Tax=Nostoc sp. FACHB-888 TaxID=2692842 RepID=UPI001689C9F1|nr:hypothetical protein [Nostoc sp. FACHB-888]MBD2245221.1 hypothetical protein [Nostoc sp. FACHB-888]